MEKFMSVIFIFLIGTALGSSARRPKAVVGVLKDLPRVVDPFIIGGEKVQGREFPAQISLQVDGNHNCGGSIVNEHYIVTAAHCSQYPAGELSVLSGTNSLTNGGTRHQVTEIHYHEKYDPAHSWHNDVAVMKVDPPFVFDADHNTAPVTLAVQGETTPIGSEATVIGWGVDSISVENRQIVPNSSFTRMLPDDLYKVDILIWNHTLCEEDYGSMGYKVFPEQICANTNDGGKGSCQGDSGGPLFVNGEVVGLVSWARGCDLKGYPTVYTRVSAYRDWIDSKVNA